jgi:tetratricopeptide (TPR) repeat protein
MTIKFVSRLLAVVMLLVSAACHPKAKDITPLQRKAAANLESEAQFAVTLRDYARAEQLYAQAAGLCPDNPSYWVNLGICRRRLDQRAGAKQAYEAALGAYRDAYARDAKDPQPLIEQIYVLALLGRQDDARAVLQKVRAAHGNEPGVGNFTNQTLDQMLADPGFRETAL